jgi:hypothetical protein
MMMNYINYDFLAYRKMLARKFVWRLVCKLVLIV